MLIARLAGFIADNVKCLVLLCHFNRREDRLDIILQLDRDREFSKQPFPFCLDWVNLINLILLFFSINVKLLFHLFDFLLVLFDYLKCFGDIDSYLLHFGHYGHPLVLFLRFFAVAAAIHHIILLLLTAFGNESLNLL